MTISTRKAYNSAMLMVRTLKLSRDVGRAHQQMILRANVKVPRTFSTKKLDNLAMLGYRTLRLRRDGGRGGGGGGITIYPLFFFKKCGDNHYLQCCKGRNSL